jgi:seryl-tRNA synthetase
VRLNFKEFAQKLPLIK